jgi:dinuclear metal center YbgI/SA1388 family protein
MKWPTILNVTAFLNEQLRVKSIKDASLNGLQVRSRAIGGIKKVGFAVDACLSTFEMALEQEVDLLVVHHGIKWRPRKDQDLESKRATFLKKNDLALYAAHLPLDLHQEYGNNIQLCRMLSLTNVRKFGRYHGIKIGYAGALRKATGLDALAKTLNKELKTSCSVHCFGSDRVRSLGIISGGGGSMLKQAVLERLDCFLVGEIDLAVYNAAKEYGMNLIVAGHYATETIGVRSLMPLVQDVFGVEAIFIDDPKKI